MKRLRVMEIVLAAILLLILGGGGLILLFATSSRDFTTAVVGFSILGIALLFFLVLVFRGERLRRFNFGKDKHGRKLGWPDRW